MRGRKNLELTFPPICLSWQCPFRPKSTFSRDLSRSRLLATSMSSVTMTPFYDVTDKVTLHQSEFIYKFSRFQGTKGVIWGIKRKLVSLPIKNTCFLSALAEYFGRFGSETFNMLFGHRKVKEHIHLMKIYAKRRPKSFQVARRAGHKVSIPCKGG